MINIPRQRTISLDYKNLALSTIKEKYNYFLVGIGVVILLLVAVTLWFLKSYKPVIVKKAAKVNVKQMQSKAEIKTYTVKEGDYLWKIAEEAYGSGFNAIDISKTNKLADPNIITIGQKLILPAVAARTPTRGEIAMVSTQKVTFTGDTYTVQQGDYLWKIALEAYGDGYAWTRIAKANNLANPDIIFVGATLTIPR